MHDWSKMKKFTILIPVYNDWESLKKLLSNINDIIKNMSDVEFNCIIINDSSTTNRSEIKIPSNIKSVKIIHMNKNKGHARCNAFGIKYLSKNLDLDYLILMDGDGEDRPEELKLLVDKVLSEPDISVVAKRIKRSEGPLFQLFYRLHKYLTLFTTGKLINFGNYSCLTKSDIKILSTKASLWSSFSGSFKKYIKNYNDIKIDKNLEAAIITPDIDIIPGANTYTPAYLIFSNYEKVLNWNRSLRFALAVCTLKDNFKNEI